MAVDIAAKENPIKISKRPEIQQGVEGQVSKIQGKHPEVSLDAATAQARDKVASEIVRKRLRQELGRAKENSLVDSLTGLRNHRWFEQELAEKIEGAKRHPENAFWFQLMDFDDFKQFNDVDYAVGNKVLRVMSKVSNRPGEDIARWGGDEFAQINNTDITDEDSVKIAMRNAQAVYDISQAVLGSDEDAVRSGIKNATVSIALVKYQPGMTAEVMLKIASKLIKEAKENKQKDTILVTADSGATSQEHHRQI